jgi:hypothetical protein
VVQALVYTLSDAFDAATDLYETLKIKERRDYEQSLRSKGYPSSRRIKYVDDGSFGKDEDPVLDKAAVTRQFEVGYRSYGERFAVGDGQYCANPQDISINADLFELTLIRSLVGSQLAIPNHRTAERRPKNGSLRPYLRHTYLATDIKTEHRLKGSWYVFSGHSGTSNTTAARATIT